MLSVVYTVTDLIRHEMMRVVSFSGFNAVNITLYCRIFIWGHRPQKKEGAASQSPPVATRVV